MRALLAILLIGCGGSNAPRCAAGFVGSRSAAPQVKMMVTDGRSMTLREVADGDEIPMEPPPQGGFVIYIGAEANNVDACEIQVAATLRDPTSGNQESFESRTINMIVGDDGWARSDPSNDANEANVAVCPDFSMKDRVNGQFTLELKVTDHEKRTASVTHPVKLVCDPALAPADEAECMCACSANYMLGKCGGVGLDGGTPD